MFKALPHSEPRCEVVERRAPLLNLAASGCRRAVRTTRGKVSQPIDAASRGALDGPFTACRRAVSGR